MKSPWPAPAIALVTFTIGGALQQTIPLPLTGLAAPGFLLMLVGAWLVIWAWSRLLAANTTIWPWRRASALVQEGPYRFSRNPMYLGLVVGMLGLALAVGSGWLVLMTLLTIVAIDRFTIRREEPRLTRQLGEPYKRYSATVRRWL